MVVFAKLGVLYLSSLQGHIIIIISKSISCFLSVFTYSCKVLFEIPEISFRISKRKNRSRAVIS